MNDKRNYPAFRNEAVNAFFMKELDVYRQIISQVCHVNNLFEIPSGRSLLINFKE